MKKTSVILIVPVVIILAAGTIIEKYHGNAFAVDHVYNSWWFILLLTAVGVACIYTIVRNKLWRNPHQLLLYSSAVVILLGGGLTTWTGQHGNLVLEEGIPNRQCTTDDGDSFDLPFDVTLQRFELMTYPGSKAPMDFVSHVTVEGDNAVISMNNIYRHKGYRFYQADYDMQGGSTLSVAHDPLGIGVTYAGYLLAIAGLMWRHPPPCRDRVPRRWDRCTYSIKGASAPCKPLPKTSPPNSAATPPTVASPPSRYSAAGCSTPQSGLKSQ